MPEKSIINSLYPYHIQISSYKCARSCTLLLQHLKMIVSYLNKMHGINRKSHLTNIISIILVIFQSRIAISLYSKKILSIYQFFNDLHWNKVQEDAMLLSKDNLTQKPWILVSDIIATKNKIRNTLIQNAILIQFLKRMMRLKILRI